MAGPIEDEVIPLSPHEREEIFRIATRGFVRRHSTQCTQGMSDDELWCALQEYLGIFGGCDGPDQPSVTYQGAGLKIWGGRRVVNHVTQKPLYKGMATVKMAREIYGIADPDNDQLDLFQFL